MTVKKKPAAPAKAVSTAGIEMPSQEITSEVDIGPGEQLGSGVQGDGSPIPPIAEIRARALRLIEHDGVRYGPGQDAGEEVGLGIAQFELLHLSGAIERLEE